MANKQHAQFSDENGNLFYLENHTEDVLDPSGKPLSDGGDLSEASVKFSVDTSRKLPQSGGRFKAFLGSIVKYLTDLGAAAYLAVANNDTTTQPGFVGDARVLKQHRDAINQLNSELHQNIFEDLGVFYDTGSLDATKFYKGLYQSNGKQYVFFQLPSVFSVQILFLNTEAEAEIDSIAFRISPGGNFSGIAWTWLKYSSKTPSA